MSSSSDSSAQTSAVVISKDRPIFENVLDEIIGDADLEEDTEEGHICHPTKDLIAQQQYESLKSAHLSMQQIDESKGQPYAVHVCIMALTLNFIEKLETSDSSQLPNSLKEKHSIRYFIVKTFTEKHLTISMKKGIWATQEHNEKKFNEAFEVTHRFHRRLLFF